MSKIIIIAWREFSQTVLRKVFLLAIIGIPVLIVGAMLLVLVVVDIVKVLRIAGWLAPGGRPVGSSAGRETSRTSSLDSF